MMKSTRLIVAGAAVALLPLSAFAQSTEAPPQQQGTTFESLDTNSDGRISKEEAAANENVKTQFAKYDVNGDGFIERAEVASANQSQAPAQKQP